MSFDASQATASYIDQLGPDLLSKAAAYTTGNHWLLLWGLICSGLVTWILVRTRVLEKLKDQLSRRGWFLRTFLVCIAYLILAALLSLPWNLYSDWWREYQYGRTSQPLGDFLSQGAIALVISTLVGGLFLTLVYGLIRKAGRLWWFWAGGLTTVFSTVMLLVTPVFIEPLFNDYQPVPPGEVRDAVEELAVQAGIPADRIFMYDGSRQSNNFTANVAGLGSSARIAISDVALKDANLDEVRAVTAHEIGHYKLGHVWRYVILFTILSMAFFFLASRIYPVMARWFGSPASIADPAGLPVLLLIVSILVLAGEPLLNSVIRRGEVEADQYSLQTAGLPDALASALAKTAVYRNPRPNPVDEFLFYSHPSVERRIRAAMEWKAAHLDASTPNQGSGGQG
jgi:STE24 endopeptidase